MSSSFPTIQERIATAHANTQEWLAIQDELDADTASWKKAKIYFYFRNPEFYQLLWAHHRLEARCLALSSRRQGIAVCVDEVAITNFMLADKEWDCVPENARVTVTSS